MPERAFYHANPEILSVETPVIDAKPGRVLLAETPYYPGGGGQLADRGLLRHARGEVAVTGFDTLDGQLWTLLADPAAELAGTVQAVVDPAFRQMMRELHTGTHVLNAFVFQAFNGALVTGVQMYEDGTARMDFDLPEAGNDRLRTLEGPINDVVRQSLPVRDVYLPLAVARDEHGLIRSKSAWRPHPLKMAKFALSRSLASNRQAAGGTHLSETGASRAIRILKIENKGRQNRRLRIGLVNA